MLKADLELLLSRRIPLQIFTDSKTLFDVIVRGSTTRERRLMIDIYATRQAYRRDEIADIGLIRSEYNLADCMTKIMKPKQMLRVMKIGVLRHPVEQFVLRPKLPNNEEICFVEKGGECRTKNTIESVSIHYSTNLFITSAVFDNCITHHEKCEEEYLTSEQFHGTEYTQLSPKQCLEECRNICTPTCLSSQQFHQID